MSERDERRKGRERRRERKGWFPITYSTEVTPSSLLSLPLRQLTRQRTDHPIPPGTNIHLVKDSHLTQANRGLLPHTTREKAGEYERLSQ